MFLNLLLRIGNRETYETYGMLVIEINILQQFLCCWQDMLHLSENLAIGMTACYLHKVMELYLQCECISIEITLIQPSDQFLNDMIQFNNDSTLLEYIPFKRHLTANTLTHSLSHNRTFVNATCKVVVYLASLSEFIYQASQ